MPALALSFARSNRVQATLAHDSRNIDKTWWRGIDGKLTSKVLNPSEATKPEQNHANPMPTTVRGLCSE
jgi:hypothetical protein